MLLVVGAKFPLEMNLTDGVWIHLGLPLFTIPVQLEQRGSGVIFKGLMVQEMPF